MSSSVGELFISLGVKGSEKTLSAFATVQTGLGNMKSMSLETKAAIIAAVYAIEQLTSHSNQMGTAFVNAGAELGIPIKILQQYSNAAQLAGVSTQELFSNLGQIQNKLKSINVNEGVPKWMGRIQDVLHHAFTAEEVEKYAKNPQAFLSEIIQPYARAEKDIPWRNLTLDQWLNGGMKDAVIRQKFNQKSLNTISPLSDHQMQNLDDNRRRFAEISLKIQKDFDTLNASDGMTHFTESLLHLVDALDKLEKRFHWLERIGKAFDFLGGEVDILSWAGRLISGENPESVRKDISKDSFMGRLLEKNKQNEAARAKEFPGVGADKAAILQDLMYRSSQFQNPPQINITQIFQGKADPHQVKGAAKEGVLNATGRQDNLGGKSK